MGLGEGNGNPLQCSCLENPRDGGAWWAAIYGVAQSRTQLKWLSSSSRRCQGYKSLFSALSVKYCCCSVSKSCLTLSPWIATRQASLSLTIPQSLLRLMSIESLMLSNHLILCGPFSYCLQSFPASGSFPVSQVFASGGQSIGASASASILPMNIEGCFPLGLTGLILLQSNGLTRIFSSTTIWNHQFFGAQPSFWYNSHIHTWLLEKP